MSLDKILQNVRFAQVGFVVKDIHQTAEEYARLFGVEKPNVRICGDYSMMQTRIYGAPAPDANSWLAFIPLTPGVELELIQPNEASSVWRDAMEKYGEGIHHLAFKVQGADEVARQLVEEFDAVIEQQGTYSDGSGQYIYLDCFKRLKCRIELLESYKEKEQKAD